MIENDELLYSRFLSDGNEDGFRICRSNHGTEKLNG